MTPMLYPAGTADPRQQVAPPSTNNGVHPAEFCAFSYKRNRVDQQSVHHKTRFHLFHPF